MENSLLTAFLNFQPIVPQKNRPFDQTNKECYLLLIFKKELLTFFFSLNTYLCFNFLRRIFIYSIYIQNFTEVQIFLFPILQKICWHNCYILQAF